MKKNNLSLAAIQLPLQLRQYAKIDLTIIQNGSERLLQKYNLPMPSRSVNYQEISQSEDYWLQKYKPINQNLFEEVMKQPNLKLKRFKNCIFFGSEVNSQLEGLGVLIWESGKIYEGEFHQGFKEGVGSLLAKSGAFYQGFFFKGKPHGEGVFRWASGEVFSGNWKNGQKQGNGTWKGIRGDIYIGQWTDGQCHGFGKHLWVNGDMYLGEFQNNLKHGFGMEWFGNGDRYKGEYLYGKPCGIGIYNWNSGAQYVGQFGNGMRNGKGKWEYKELCYDGEYKNDKKHGLGEYWWSNGTHFSGRFQNDKRHGQGEMFWKDGSHFDGEWAFGKMNGKGQMTQGNQKIIGIWKDNAFVSEDQEAKNIYKHQKVLETFTSSQSIQTKKVKHDTRSLDVNRVNNRQITKEIRSGTISVQKSSPKNKLNLLPKVLQQKQARSNSNKLRYNPQKFSEDSRFRSRTYDDQASTDHSQQFSFQAKPQLKRKFQSDLSNESDNMEVFRSQSVKPRRLQFQALAPLSPKEVKLWQLKSEKQRVPQKFIDNLDDPEVIKSIRNLMKPKVWIPAGVITGLTGLNYTIRYRNPS